MDKSIKALIVVHVIAVPATTAIVASGYGWPSPFNSAWSGLIFSSAGLIGRWAAMGTQPCWFRLSGMTLWLSCLSFAMAFGSAAQFWTEPAILGTFAVIVTFPAMVTFTMFWGLRRARRVVLAKASRLSASSDGLQFSIFNLLAATAVIASALAIRKAFQALMPQESNEFSILMIGLLVAAVVPCVVLVELATTWGALGLRRPLPRLLLVVPGSFLIGIIPPFYLAEECNVKEYLAWSTVTGSQALITSATLLVFRSSGWRLCRMAASHQQAPVEDAGSDEAPQSAALCDR